MPHGVNQKKKKTKTGGGGEYILLETSGALPANLAYLPPCLFWGAESEKTMRYGKVVVVSHPRNPLKCLIPKCGAVSTLQKPRWWHPSYLHFPPWLTKSECEIHCSLSHSSTRAWLVRKPWGATFMFHTRRAHHSPCRTAGPQEHLTGSSFLLALTSKDNS